MFSILTFFFGVSMIHFSYSEKFKLYEDGEESYFSSFYGAENAETINWFNTEFKAHYQPFEKYIHFSYYPCYDATASSDNRTLTCPEPDPSCYMNKIHACADNYFKAGPKLNAFILCTFENGLQSVSKCADPNDGKVLNECAKNVQGVELCIAKSQNTMPFNHMPSFVVHGFYKPPFDMTDALCRELILRHMERPDVCNSIHEC